MWHALCMVVRLIIQAPFRARTPRWRSKTCCQRDLTKTVLTCFQGYCAIRVYFSFVYRKWLPSCSKENSVHVLTHRHAANSGQHRNISRDSRELMETPVFNIANIAGVQPSDNPMKFFPAAFWTLSSLYNCFESNRAQIEQTCLA